MVPRETLYLVARPVTVIAGTISACPAIRVAPSLKRLFIVGTVTCSPRLRGPFSTAPHLMDISPAGPGGSRASAEQGAHGKGNSDAENDAQFHVDTVGVLIFRLGVEWLAVSYADRCRSYRSATRASCAPPIQRDFRRIGKSSGPGSALRFASRIARRDGTGSPHTTHRAP